MITGILPAEPSAVSRTGAADVLLQIAPKCNAIEAIKTWGLCLFFPYHFSKFG